MPQGAFGLVPTLALRVFERTLERLWGVGAEITLVLPLSFPVAPKKWLCWYSQLHDQVEVGCALINIF